MNVVITKQFSKDVDKIKNTIFRSKLKALIQDVRKIETLSSINSLKKIVSSKNCYRIRIGDYRAGIVVDGNTVYFARAAHRSKIYKIFP